MPVKDLERWTFSWKVIRTDFQPERPYLEVLVRSLGGWLGESDHGVHHLALGPRTQEHERQLGVHTRPTIHLQQITAQCLKPRLIRQKLNFKACFLFIVEVWQQNVYLRCMRYKWTGLQTWKYWKPRLIRQELNFKAYCLSLQKYDNKNLTCTTRDTSGLTFITTVKTISLRRAWLVLTSSM